MQVAVCTVAALLRMLLPLSPSAVAQLTPITHGNIKSAVSEWTTNSTTATAKYGDIGGWNVAAVTSMGNLFYNKPAFNADLGRWNVASVSDMYYMFFAADAFNQNIASWNTASVSDLYMGDFGVCPQPKQLAARRLAG